MVTKIDVKKITGSITNDDARMLTRDPFAVANLVMALMQ